MSDTHNSPEFSLIISTLGSAKHLRQGLASILMQTYDSFEVIIVDQNDSGDLLQIIEVFRETGKIRYTKSKVGLSRGRNAGLIIARGRIIGFPDDDCEYPVTLLADVKAEFLSHDNASAICVRCCDHAGHDSAGRLDRKGGLVTKSNVWSRVVSVGIFVQADILKEIGAFDENIGLGSNTPYQSGEETDLMLRLISLDRSAYYNPNLTVFHPRGSHRITTSQIDRAYDYGLGKGRILRRYKYRKREIALHFAKPVLGALMAIIGGNLGLARLRLQRAKGRFDGWRSSLPSALERQ
ncbi:glycosyltransferase family 2 protein [Methylobacterium sp. WL64]|uniref:glycosyltransferase family 2 protein n=1 Tax=Methylobacterium sp. WL64 TaxID=2603894 RepID=UPI0011C7D0B1|nr:glycosyltransferase family 2 protein [Methylobacterium sp. WL64]TXM97199.1 glycosyltransferase family 2 protein [Methylobacterium sp. WL64]